MPQIETKVLTAHVPLPLAEKVDQMAARLDQEEERIFCPDNRDYLSCASEQSKRN